MAAAPGGASLGLCSYATAAGAYDFVDPDSAYSLNLKVRHATSMLLQRYASMTPAQRLEAMIPELLQNFWDAILRRVLARATQWGLVTSDNAGRVPAGEGSYLPGGLVSRLVRVRRRGDAFGVWLVPPEPGTHQLLGVVAVTAPGQLETVQLGEHLPSATVLLPATTTTKRELPAAARYLYAGGFGVGLKQLWTALAHHGMGELTVAGTCPPPVPATSDAPPALAMHCREHATHQLAMICSTRLATTAPGAHLVELLHAAVPAGTPTLHQRLQLTAPTPGLGAMVQRSHVLLLFGGAPPADVLTSPVQVNDGVSVHGMLARVPPAVAQALYGADAMPVFVNGVLAATTDGAAAEPSPHYGGEADALPPVWQPDKGAPVAPTLRMAVLLWTDRVDALLPPSRATQDFPRATADIIRQATCAMVNTLAEAPLNEFAWQALTQPTGQAWALLQDVSDADVKTRMHHAMQAHLTQAPRLFLHDDLVACRTVAEATAKGVALDVDGAARLSPHAARLHRWLRYTTYNRGSEHEYVSASERGLPVCDASELAMQALLKLTSAAIEDAVAWVDPACTLPTAPPGRAVLALMHQLHAYGHVLHDHARAHLRAVRDAQGATLWDGTAVDHDYATLVYWHVSLGRLGLWTPEELCVHSSTLGEVEQLQQHALMHNAWVVPVDDVVDSAPTLDVMAFVRTFVVALLQRLPVRAPVGWAEGVASYVVARWPPAPHLAHADLCLDLPHPHVDECLERLLLDPILNANGHVFPAWAMAATDGGAPPALRHLPLGPRVRDVALSQAGPVLGAAGQMSVRLGHVSVMVQGCTTRQLACASQAAAARDVHAMSPAERTAMMQAERTAPTSSNCAVLAQPALRRVRLVTREGRRFVQTGQAEVEQTLLWFLRAAGLLSSPGALQQVAEAAAANAAREACRPTPLPRKRKAAHSHPERKRQRRTETATAPPPTPTPRLPAATAPPPTPTPRPPASARTASPPTPPPLPRASARTAPSLFIANADDWAVCGRV